MRGLLALSVVLGCGSGGGGATDAAADAPVDASVADQVAQDAADAAPATGTILATGVNYPFCLAADATNVYYCSGGDVFMVPIAGGTPTLLATNPNHANNWAIVAGTNVVYVLDAAGYTAAVPVPNGGWTWVEHTMPLVPGYGLVLVGTKLYWVAQPAKEVMQVDVTVDGGALTPVATNQTSPVDIAGDSSQLFWANQDTQDAGAIVGMSLPPAAPVPLAPALAASRLAIDAANVYYIAAGEGFQAALAVPRAGGSPTEILNTATGLTPGERPVAITANGAVYVATNYPYWNRIYKVGASGGTMVVNEKDGAIPEILADATNLYWVTGDAVNGGVIKKAPKP